MAEEGSFLGLGHWPNVDIGMGFSVFYSPQYGWPPKFSHNFHVSLLNGIDFTSIYYFYILRGFRKLAMTVKNTYNLIR